jgi:hypothetical protein
LSEQTLRVSPFGKIDCGLTAVDHPRFLSATSHELRTWHPREKICTPEEAQQAPSG